MRIDPDADLLARAQRLDDMAARAPESTRPSLRIAARALIARHPKGPALLAIRDLEIELEGDVSIERLHEINRGLDWAEGVLSPRDWP